MLRATLQRMLTRPFARLRPFCSRRRAVLTAILCMSACATAGCGDGQRKERGRAQLRGRVAEQLRAAEAKADTYDFESAHGILRDLSEEVDRSPFADVATFDTLNSEIDAVSRTISEQESEYRRKIRAGWRVIAGRLISPEDQPRAIAEQKREEQARRAAQEEERSRRARREVPASSGQRRARSTPGQTFLRSKLAELDSFKSNPAFHRFGFGAGGPFHSWLKTVESRQDDSSFSLHERVAVGDLQMLGLEYVTTKGCENNYTRYARQSIRQVIGD